MSAPAPAAIDDAAFNALLGEFVELTRRVLLKTDRDHYQLMVVLATGGDHAYRTLDAPAAGAPTDLIERMTGFGADLKREGVRFDAVLVAGELPVAADGLESLLISGATLDGRRNSAILELRRDSERSLRVRTVKVQPYAPHTWVMQPQRHPAAALVDAWTAATAPAAARPWWKPWG